MHHEIPEDALMNDIELAGLEPHLLGQPEEANNIQVAMVRIVEENLAHLWPSFSRPNVMPWEKTGSEKESSLTVAIPKEWATFFCSLLRDSSNFAWAKDCPVQLCCFTQSQWVCHYDWGPKKPHSKDSETCLKLSDWQPISVEEEASLGDDNNSTEESLVSQPKEIKKHKKTMSKEYLVDSEVRRSNRLKTRNKGFK